MSAPDTIVALATPAGRGALGIVRVSGPGVQQVALALLGCLPPPRSARLAAFRDADGGAIDRGLVLYFPAPASFTGEHVLELQGHGGAVVNDLLLRRILELGCRQARPGEFSERAFLNGKMDIAQAEAVADLIDAGTAAAARAAVRSLQGEFSARVCALQAQLTALRIHVEAAIDFPDEEIDWLSDADLSAALGRVFGDFESLEDAARQGALLREGLTVVIAGKPNAGKSSLLNALVGDDVAIVTQAPGTTRDLLHHPVQLDGLPLMLTDTAGLRDAQDAAEAEGVRRARGAMGRADHVLYVMDASRPTAPAELAAELASLPQEPPFTLVLNKIDLLPPNHASHAGPAPTAARTWLSVSARTGAGLQTLREHLKNVAGYGGPDAGALSARRRHLVALQGARAHVTAAAAALRETRACELFAEELRLAQQSLGEITGEFTSEDLLGEIFGSFCIGK